MSIPFNQRKATQAAAYMLQKSRGRMNYMKLIKLLYLSDRASLEQYARPITTDCYVSMDNGPVLSRVLNLINQGPRPTVRNFWNESIGDPQAYDVTLRQDPGTDELSEVELETMDNVFRRFGGLNEWGLVDYTHTLPEWQDPNGSSIPIYIQDILGLTGKTPLEIAAIRDELSELERANYLLKTG